VQSAAVAARPTAASTSRIQSWRLNPTARFVWRDWGTDSVVLEVRSGETLQFDPLSAAVMACIEAGAVDFGTVNESLASDLGVAPDALAESLWTILERLNRLGWIEPEAAESP